MNFLKPILTKSFEITKCCCVSSLVSIRYKSSKDATEGTPKSLQSKYQIFKENKSEVILDIYEESSRNSQYGYNLSENEEIEGDMYKGLNLNRGLNGVYDIEDLIDVLKIENGMDICVVKVPEEVQYTDYICLVTGKSVRHMQAIAQLVRRVYKMKRRKHDVVPKLEGSNSKDWLALDLGNIALHIFSTQARVLYDLDSLWAVGPQLDPEYNKKDPLVEMLEKNTFYLSDLKPAS